MVITLDIVQHLQYLETNCFGHRICLCHQVYGLSEDLGVCPTFFVQGATAPRVRGLLIVEVSRPHALVHSRHTTFGRKQNSQETDTHAPGGFEPETPASEWLQTHALDCATTGIGKCPKYLSCVLEHRP
jgi:hypothetical protein